MITAQQCFDSKLLKVFKKYLFQSLENIDVTFVPLPGFYKVFIFIYIFFLNFQAGLTPCTSGGKGKKSILPSCIARTGSEEELQELAKRPISPGHRGTTWNGNGNESSMECFIFAKFTLFNVNHGS